MCVNEVFCKDGEEVTKASAMLQANLYKAGKHLCHFCRLVVNTPAHTRSNPVMDSCKGIERYNFTSFDTILPPSV